LALSPITTRRAFLKTTSVGTLSLLPLTSPHMIAAPKRKSSDIASRRSMLAMRFVLTALLICSAAAAATAVTILNVHCTVETVAGRVD